MSPTEELHRVFAFGSNMNQRDLERWFRKNGYDFSGVLGVEPGYLDNSRLAWNYLSPVRAGGAANVESAPGQSVPGLILTLDDRALQALDHKEGAPERYRRSLERIRVSEDDYRDAWVYRVTPEFTQAEFTAPKREYIALLVAAAREFRFAESYVEYLQSIETLD